MGSRIFVPRLNDGHDDFCTMAQIWQQVTTTKHQNDIEFDFTQCQFLQPNAVVFLGGLARLISQRGNRPFFLVDTMHDSVHMNLLQNGFGHAMGATTSPWQGNSIPYREYLSSDQNAIAQDLRQNWLGRGWINISESLANELVGQMWEMFANAFEHSNSTIGVYSCGQYFHTRKILTLVVADFGIGIPAKVRQHLGRPDMTAVDAMKWAFQRGHSTSSQLGPRGVGLDLLKELVKKTNGKMLAYSHDGMVRIDAKGEIYGGFQPFFGGTLV